jgi:hypothetical protein
MGELFVAGGASASAPSLTLPSPPPAGERVKKRVPSPAGGEGPTRGKGTNGRSLH